MIKVIHDTTVTTRFRDPAGASQAGSPVHLTVLLSGEPEGAIPVLCIRFDKDGSTREVPMAPAGDGTHAAFDDPAARPGFGAFSADFTPEETGLYWYWFQIRQDDIDGHTMATVGRGDGGCAVLTDEPRAWQMTVYEPAYADPDWIWGGVYYHVFVDRFAASGEPIHMDGKITRDDWGGMPEYLPNENGEIMNNDFFGGNLEGLREKLPYLADLGVTCIYLSPIFEAFSSHKYDTTDYMKVDPMFGDEEGFTRLCAEAAEMGMRIICDGVFSHTGADSRYFDIYDRYGDGAYNHPDSPYRDWYYFEEDGGYQSWWGFSTLPRIRKDNPAYQEFITGENGVIRHWLRAGASGWRLDVVDELPVDFVEKLTASAKAEKADALVLGEVWEDASSKIAYEERKNYFEGNKLDSVMNYPLRQGIIDFVRNGDARAISRPVSTILENYPARVVHSLMNLLGSHDTDRIITALAGQRLGPDATREIKAVTAMDPQAWATGIRRLKMAVVLQMTLPGVPCVYYGDEAGIEGYNDPFNRKCFPWGHENKELQDWYRRVIAIRRENHVYKKGAYRLLSEENGLYAFARTDGESPTGSDASATLITAANCGGELQYLRLFGTWTDLLTGKTYRDDVPVLPGQAMILKQ